MANVSIPGSDGGVCVICNETVAADASAICIACGEPYHLVLTQDVGGKDCGEVWLNEEFLALEFGCARCVAEHRGQPPPAPPDGPPARAVKRDGVSARDIVRRKRR